MDWEKFYPEQISFSYEFSWPQVHESSRYLYPRNGYEYNIEWLKLLDRIEMKSELVIKSHFKGENWENFEFKKIKIILSFILF